MKSQLSINLRYCYLSGRATQNISASRSLPTIGFKSTCHGLPLSAVTVSLHYLPRCLHWTVTCGKTATTVTWSAPLKICCHVIATQQMLIVEQFAPEFRKCICSQRSGLSELHFMPALYQNSELTFCSVSVTSANKLSLQELTQPIEINCLFYVFNKCLLLSPNFQGGQMPFLPSPLRTPMYCTMFCREIVTFWIKKPCTVI